MEYCQNCGSELHDIYCAHCGRKAKPVERITLVYLIRELITSLTHLERGFLYTSRQLLIAPGKTAKEYIDGERDIHQSPISYFIIWTTVYILFLFWIEKAFGANAAINYMQYYGPDTTTRFAISHLSIVLVVLMPFDTLYLWLLVTREQYYYFETMIAIIYAFGTVILLQCLFAAGSVIFHFLSHESADLWISDVLKIAYIVWFTFDFVRLCPRKYKFIRSIAFIILAFGSLTLWRIYLVPPIIQMFFLKN